MAVRISSTHNPRVKDAIKLRSARGRGRQERILIDGLREVQRALQAGVELEEVFACLASTDAGEERGLSSLESAGVPVYLVPANVFSRLAYGDRAHGVLAVARAPITRWTESCCRAMLW